MRGIASRHRFRRSSLRVAERGSFSVHVLYLALHSGTSHKFLSIAGNFRKSKVARNNPITAENLRSAAARRTLPPDTAQKRTASAYVARPGVRRGSCVPIFATTALWRRRSFKPPEVRLSCILTISSYLSCRERSGPLPMCWSCCGVWDRSVCYAGRRETCPNKARKGAKLSLFLRASPDRGTGGLGLPRRRGLESVCANKEGSSRPLSYRLSRRLPDIRANLRHTSSMARRRCSDTFLFFHQSNQSRQSSSTVTVSLRCSMSACVCYDWLD